MNLLESTDEASRDVFYANFNQDCTSLAVGSKKEVKFYSFKKVDELEVIHGNVTDDIRIIERLFSSNFVALVTISAPQKLKVWHLKERSEMFNCSYSNTILSVKLNRTRLVVCLEDSLHIHSIRDMKVVYIIRDTPPNPLGLCILSSNDENNFLAYPGSSSIGEVQIFDACNLRSKNMIPAHESRLAAMAFDATGTKIATASEKGTLIRVFSVIDKTKLHEFRRGVKRCVQIYSLCFSEDSNFLGASSNTETVHIFRLGNLREERPSEDPQSWSGYFSNVLCSSASMLPHVGDMLNQERSFATVHLPFSGLRNICALAMIQESLRVLIFFGKSILYIYNVDPVKGGDCVLEHTYSLLETNKKSRTFLPLPLLPNNSSDLSSVPTDAPNTRRPLQTENQPE